MLPLFMLLYKINNEEIRGKFDSELQKSILRIVNVYFR